MSTGDSLDSFGDSIIVCIIRIIIFRDARPILRWYEKSLNKGVLEVSLR